MGSSRRRVTGLGGDNSLRGYGPQRFTDDVRYLFNAEGRYLLRSHRVMGQHLEWKAIAFVDAGRVWPDLQAVRPSGINLTCGTGLRLVWDQDLTIRSEIAISDEGAKAIARLRSSF